MTVWVLNLYGMCSGSIPKRARGDLQIFLVKPCLPVHTPIIICSSYKGATVFNSLAVLYCTVLFCNFVSFACCVQAKRCCALGSRLRSPAWLTGFLAVLFSSDHFQMCSSHIHRRDPPSIMFPPLTHALFFYPEVHFLFSGV